MQKTSVSSNQMTCSSDIKTTFAGAATNVTSSPHSLGWLEIAEEDITHPMMYRPYLVPDGM